MTVSLKISLFVYAAFALVGCGSSHKGQGQSDVELPAACDEFVASYGRLVAAASPGAGPIAEARMRQTRASLEAQARHGNLPALEAQCRDAQRTIPASAKSSPL